MERNKLLSIIIPAYNAEKYILECLESLRYLLGESLEILVINDGSNDKTETLVLDYSKHDKRMKLLSIPNGGVSHARNIGLDNAEGKYIMFLDSDDYLNPEVFHEIEKIIQKGQFDFFAFSRIIIEEDGRKWTDTFSFKEAFTKDNEQIDSIMYADSMFNECWGKLYKRTIVEKYKIRFPEDIPLGEDLMFVMEYYSHCKTVCATQQPLVMYRQHGESTMKKYDISDRLKYTQILYDYSKKFIPHNMKNKAQYYNFKVLTNLCREYSKDRVNKAVLQSIYSSQMAEDVMSELDGSIIPIYRKHEYFMMKNKLLYFSSLYYYFKAKVH